jgi:hypothetical protein
VSENSRLVERITITIKAFENGKWAWKVRQRFLKEPHIDIHAFLKILDELKIEIAKNEGIEIIQSSLQTKPRVPAPKKPRKKTPPAK